MSACSSPPRVRVINRQPIVRIAPAVVRALVAFCMNRTSHMPAARTWAEITVTITDSRTIARVKSHCFEREEVTDVVAIPYAPIAGEGQGWTAEVFVNAERAQKLARRWHWSTARELALYLAHGCDHLRGGTDRTRAGRLCMRRRELRWLRVASRLLDIESLATLRDRCRKGRS